jgi:hypothetical protein
MEEAGLRHRRDWRVAAPDGGVEIWDTFTDSLPNFRIENIDHI